MRRYLILVIVLATLAMASGPERSVAGSAQIGEVPENRGAVAVLEALQRLRTTASVLHTTAHPDDEDAGLLTWLSRGQGVRTGLLTLNRGEGGANLVGSELYDGLGLLRTEELLAAGRFYAVDQMFTRVADFGFSKRLDETIEHWGEDLVLGDVVRGIRLYRPDVIVSRFHGKARDGHGNHQAAGLLSREAFKAAADPARFPEHFREGLRPWQVKKLYFSVRESESIATLKIDVGDYSPLAGRSYREIARDGFSLHRSQGAGQGRAAPGPSLTGVMLVESVIAGSNDEKSLFAGLNTAIPDMRRLAGGEDLTPELTEISRRVESAIAGFDAREPSRIAPELAAGMRATRQAIAKVRAAGGEGEARDHLLFLLGNKEREFNLAMNLALGLAIEALVDPLRPVEGAASFFQSRETFGVAIPGQRFTLTATVVNRGRTPVETLALSLRTPGDWARPLGKPALGRLAYNERTRSQFEVTIPVNATSTRPHWSRQNELKDHYYAISRLDQLHLPFPPPEVAAVYDYQVDGVAFSLAEPARTVFVDRPWGEQRRLLTIAPALNIALSPRVGVVPVATNGSTIGLTVSLSSNVKGQAVGRIRLKLPTGWTATPGEQAFNFASEGEAGNFTFQVRVPGTRPGADYQIQAIAEFDGREYDEGYRVIAQRGLEPRHLYRPAAMTVRGIDVRIAPNLTVGYVMGVGDEVPASLAQLGVRVAMLGANELAGGDLDQYDAIIVGIRATAVRDDLRAYHRRLLEYAERGGNLIYQYQTQEFDAAPYGPWPYQLTARAEEVSEELSKVSVLEPANPIFNWPNPITAADFDGWVEERGSKWMSRWDDRYTPLLECHDREQPPQRGGMLFTRYGRGTFTYAAYAFYRQLPAGVSGGYRIFANLVSLRRAGK